MARRKLKPPLRSQGFSTPKPRKLTPRQLKEVKERGYTYVTIEGVRKRITSANVRKDEIWWYRRGDTKSKIAVRNFRLDRKRKARHRAIRGKGFTGD